MPGTYATTTFAAAVAEMGRRLYDPTHIHWLEPELKLYIQQAIRTFNALTNHFRDGVSFSTTNQQAFYDLPTIVPSLRGVTYTVQQAVTQIAYMLLEPPPVGNTWRGTQQYSLTDIVSALQQARDTFLLETGVLVTRQAVTVDPAPANGEVDLPETVMALRRVAYADDEGSIYVLRRDDTFGFTRYRPTWQTARAALPLAYSVSTTPPLVLTMAPPTTTTGELDLLTLDRGEAIDLLDTSQVLGVPDDWAWVVIFGALTQLFQRDGLALDMLRAKACEALWADGIQRAVRAAVVLNATVNSTPTPLGSVSDADAYSAGWQMVAGVPRRVLTTGQNLIGLWPPPGVPPAGGSYSVTLDVVRNAPVPTADTDYLQVGEEMLNDLLDYAQFLALVKEGPGQMDAAMGLLTQFYGFCGTEIRIKRASQPNLEAATGMQAVQDKGVVAYQSPR